MYFGLDTVKRYKYCFKKYCVIQSHSLNVLLTKLTTAKLSFIRDCSGFQGMTMHDKIYKVIMQ